MQWSREAETTPSPSCFAPELGPGSRRGSGTFLDTRANVNWQNGRTRTDDRRPATKGGEGGEGESLGGRRFRPLWSVLRRPSIPPSRSCGGTAPGGGGGGR